MILSVCVKEGHCAFLCCHQILLLIDSCHVKRGPWRDLRNYKIIMVLLSL